MKAVKILSVSLLILALSIPASFAQSKKKLKEEIEELKVENARLNTETQQLESNNQRLIQENRDFNEQNTALRSQLTQVQRDYDALNNQYQDLNTAYEQLNSDYQTLQSSLTSTGPGGPGTFTPTSDDNRKCAYYQGRLEPGWSYTELYGKLASEGWGIQVFASSNLCQAAEAAEEFKKNFTMYKTYLRVKDVGGSQVYAVVYGSLKYEDQAKTYLTNFKKIAPSKWGANAFLVQH